MASFLGGCCFRFRTAFDDDDDDDDVHDGKYRFINVQLALPVTGGEQPLES